MERVKFTQEEWIKRAVKVHGDGFDYSKAIYTDSKSYIDIICPVHGKFSQIAMNHLRGNGCRQCVNEAQKMSTEEFTKRASNVHSNRYGYENVRYTHSKEKVEILCPVHGPFTQEAMSHLRGCGCPLCRGNDENL